MQEVHEQIVQLGYRIVAVSPDVPEKLKELQGKLEYDLRLLGDPGLNASRALGLVFAMDAEMSEQYREYGINLVEAPDGERGLLPVPAVFIVRDGEIRFQYVDPDYKSRIDPQLLLAAAKAVKSE